MASLEITWQKERGIVSWLLGEKQEILMDDFQIPNLCNLLASIIMYNNQPTGFEHWWFVVSGYNASTSGDWKTSNHHGTIRPVILIALPTPKTCNIPPEKLVPLVYLSQSWDVRRMFPSLTPNPPKSSSFCGADTQLDDENSSVSVSNVPSWCGFDTV